MDIPVSFLVAGIISLVVFVLIYEFWPLPIRTTDPSSEEVKKYYDKGKGSFKIRSGKAPPSFFNEEFVNMLKNRNKETQIIVEDMICIGKRENGIFIPSPLLLFYFTQKKEETKIKIKTIKSGAAYLKKDNPTYHPDHFHYRIYDNAIFFHREDKITYYLYCSWYLKRKFKGRFDKEWKEGKKLNENFFLEKEKLLVEINEDKHLYEKAKDDEIEEFKRKANIKI